MQKIFTITALLSLLLSGCAVYKIDIQQGNVITQAQLDQLTAGMPAQRVRFIMGTPLLIDVFNENRWDYLYRFKAGHKNDEQHRISLFFDENQLLSHIAGDISVEIRDRPQPIIEPRDDRLPIL
jgi:outer membrane protein assembly factor BamE